MITYSLLIDQSNTSIKKFALSHSFFQQKSAHFLVNIRDVLWNWSKRGSELEKRLTSSLWTKIGDNKNKAWYICLQTLLLILVIPLFFGVRPRNNCQLPSQLNTYTLQQHRQKRTNLVEKDMYVVKW